MDINKRVKTLLELSRKAETENEKLAIWAEIGDLLSIKVHLMDKALDKMQITLQQVVKEYMRDSNQKEQILNFDYKDHINESGTGDEPLFKSN